MIEPDDGPYIEDPGEPSFFTEFMQAYPKQENRCGALREWWRIRPTMELHAKIMRSVRLLKQTDRWKQGYAPDARNFLKDRRWKDADGMVDPRDRPAPRVADSTHTATSTMQLSTPQSARAAMREGLVNGWKREHPDQEPPEELLRDPIAYLTGSVRSI